MKNKFILVTAALFILLIPGLAQAAGISVEYQKDIVLLPNSNHTLPVLIKNPGEQELKLNISCDSDLSVYCQNKLELGKQETKILFIQIKTKETGIYSINFQANNKSNKINVEVSNTPNALFELLNYYNFTLSRLLFEKGDIEVHELEQAGADLQVAYDLYMQGLYYQSNEKLEEAKDMINAGATKLSQEKLKIKPAAETQKRFSPKYLILIAVIITMCLLYLCKFLIVSPNAKINFRWDISNIKNAFNNFEDKNNIGALRKNKERSYLEKSIKEDINSIENSIKSMEKSGKNNAGDIKIWLRFAKEKYARGHLNISRRYIEKIKQEMPAAASGAEKIKRD